MSDLNYSFVYIVSTVNLCPSCLPFVLFVKVLNPQHKENTKDTARNAEIITIGQSSVDFHIAVPQLPSEAVLDVPAIASAASGSPCVVKTVLGSPVALQPVRLPSSRRGRKSLPLCGHGI